jgi:signal transduction histidine kinase
VQLGASPFRLVTAGQGADRLVAGQSLAEQQHVADVLQDGEVAVAPVLVLAMFAGSLIIGLRALSPVEQSRRRQLEFTADASHELRTPLSVISAEIGIALSAPRPAEDYRATLHRIERESQRLRSIVEDLLWLARFDSEPASPPSQPLDLGTVAAVAAERFRAVANRRSLTVRLVVPERESVVVDAAPEWLDRLAGVLVDNACRYSRPGGDVVIEVTARAGHPRLAVRDSGPGVPPAERRRIFDRFHRGRHEGEGAGLGLAIANAVVTSTEGRWEISDRPEGGAEFAVVWRRGRRAMSAPVEAVIGEPG